MNQVASALAEAHTASVVHRDLKPDNVFLVGAPDAPPFAKVVDFGISKVLKVSATKLTVARAIIGTPEFMAPEQAEGRQDHIDHRTDQWSLACVAWVALTGCLPFAGPDPNATLNQVISAVPTPPAPGAPPLAPEIEAVLRRALSKRSLDRFPDDPGVRPLLRGRRCPRSARPSPFNAAPAALPAREPPRRRPAAGLAILLAISLPILAGAAWFLRDRPPVSTYLRRAQALIQRR